MLIDSAFKTTLEIFHKIFQKFFKRLTHRVNHPYAMYIFGPKSGMQKYFGRYRAKFKAPSRDTISCAGKISLKQE